MIDGRNNCSSLVAGGKLFVYGGQTIRHFRETWAQVTVQTTEVLDIRAHLNGGQPSWQRVAVGIPLKSKCVPSPEDLNEILIFSQVQKPF